MIKYSPFCKIALLPYLYLFSLISYSLVNISTLDGGGEELLLVSGSLLLVMLSLNMRNRLYFFHSSIWFGLFAVYVIYMVAIDTSDINAMKSISIGSTGGIVLSYMLGYGSALSINSIISRLYQGINKLNFFIIITLFLLTVFLVIRIYFNYKIDIREDYFLILDRSAGYQRAGNYIFTLFIILSLLYLAVLSVLKQSKKIFVVCVFPLLCCIAIFLCLIGQLIGSNSGTATVFFFILLVFFLSFLILNDSSNAGGRVNFFALIKFYLSPKKLLLILLIIFIFSVPIFYYLQSSDLLLSEFRIFGFGEGKVTSFDSRIKLLERNFIDQFAYNPIVGNTIVDELTSGAGTYAHSLLSIFSHLGVVGAFLFFCFIKHYYQEIKIEGKQMPKVVDKKLRFVRLSLMSAVLIFATLTAFYTWWPLWFAFGALSNVFNNNYVKEL